MQTRQSIAPALFAILLFPSVARASYGNELNTALGVLFFASLYAIINTIITCINLGRKRFKAKDALYYYTLISHALFLVLILFFLLEAFVVLWPAFLLYSHVCIALPVLQYRKYASKSTMPNSPERGADPFCFVPRFGEYPLLGSNP
jgi:hypothetical protein